MSQFFDRADQIKELLEATEGLESMPWVVDRQKDVASELAANINKQAGAMGIISWTGSRNVDEGSDGPLLVNDFTITLFTKPVLRRDEVPADELVEKVICTVHDSRLNKRLAYQQRLIVTGVTPLVNEELLAYRINLKTTTQL